MLNYNKIPCSECSTHLQYTAVKTNHIPSSVNTVLPLMVIQQHTCLVCWMPHGNKYRCKAHQSWNLFLLLLECQKLLGRALCLLFQIVGVIALVSLSLASLNLHNFCAQLVEKLSVVRDNDHGNLLTLKIACTIKKAWRSCCGSSMMAFSAQTSSDILTVRIHIFYLSRPIFGIERMLCYMTGLLQAEIWKLKTARIPACQALSLIEHEKSCCPELDA